MSALSDIKSELERLAEVAGNADQPDRLAEASRSLPDHIRDKFADLAEEFAAAMAQPEASQEPAADPGAEPEPAGDPAADNPEVAG